MQCKVGQLLITYADECEQQMKEITVKEFEEMFEEFVKFK